MSKMKINTWLQKPYIAGFIYGVALYVIYVVTMSILLARAPSGGLDSLGVAIMYATAIKEVGPVTAVLVGAVLGSIGLKYLKAKRWYLYGIFGGIVSLYGALLVQSIIQAEAVPFSRVELYLASGVFGAISFCIVYLLRNIHIGLTIFVLSAIAVGVFVASYYQPGVIGDTVDVNKIARREAASPRDVYIPPPGSNWTPSGYLSRSHDDEYTVTPFISENQADFHSISHMPMHKVIIGPAVRDGKCVRVVEKRHYDGSRPIEQTTLDYVCEQIYASDETSIYLERLAADNPYHPGGKHTYYTVMPNEILLEVSPRYGTEDDARMVDFINSLRLATLEEKAQLVKNENDKHR